MSLSRDPLQRCIFIWMKKHMGAATVTELVAGKATLPGLPEELRAKAAQAFADGLRLFRDRYIMIQTVDSLWVKHLTDLDELREGIGLRAYAQRDPLVAYRTEASATYADMLDTVKEQVAGKIFNAQFSVQVPQSQAPQQSRQRAANGNGAAALAAPLNRAPIDRAINRATARTSGGGADKAAAPRPKVAAQKLGRNDTCPFCEQGKKLKHCDCEGARQWRGEM